MKKRWLPAQLVRYIVRFLLLFSLLYYGSYAVIGVSAPGGKYYSEVVSRYADYPAWLRTGLLHTSAFVLRMAGHEPKVEAPYKVRISNGRGVKLVYSCLGIGLLSFWMAGIFLVNVGRLVMLVLSANGYWTWKTDTDHHTLFNIACYLLILSMMLLFDRTEHRRLLTRSQQSIPKHDQ